MIPESITLEMANSFVPNTLMEHLGIQFTEIGSDFLVATMPVDKRHHQPQGILHGGASVSLAESVGSAASAMILGHSDMVPVGLEINANHVRPVASGTVTARAELVHGGRRSHIWDIKICNEENKLVCVSRLTVAVIPRPKK